MHVVVVVFFFFFIFLILLILLFLLLYLSIMSLYLYVYPTYLSTSLSNHHLHICLSAYITIPLIAMNRLKNKLVKWHAPSLTKEAGTT